MPYSPISNYLNRLRGHQLENANGSLNPAIAIGSHCGLFGPIHLH